MKDFFRPNKTKLILFALFMLLMISPLLVQLQPSGMCIEDPCPQQSVLGRISNIVIYYLFYPLGLIGDMAEPILEHFDGWIKIIFVLLFVAAYIYLISCISGFLIKKIKQGRA